MLKTMLVVICCVLVVGCAKPTDPESLTPGTGGYRIVATIPVPGYAQDVEIQDTLAYVAEGEGGVAVVNIGNPEAQNKSRVLGVCIQGVRGYAYKLTRKDFTLFIAAGGWGVNAINVGNPYAPSFRERYAGESVNDVKVFGDWLLESKGEWGVRFDALEGDIVDFRGRIQPPGFARGMATMPDSTLLMACGEMGLAIYNLKDIGGVTEGGGWYDDRKKYDGWIDLPGYAADVAAHDQRRIAFVACGTAGVQIVDFSDTSNIRLIGSYSTRGYAKEIAYQNGRVYVTTETRGLQILSVVDPSNPQLVGLIPTSYALGLALDQRYVYVADQSDGLLVISIPQ